MSSGVPFSRLKLNSAHKTVITVDCANVISTASFTRPNQVHILLHYGHWFLC